MPDYKQLYFQLFRRTEQLRRLLDAAQQEAEEAFLAQGDPPLRLARQEKQDGEISFPDKPE